MTRDSAPQLKLYWNQPPSSYPLIPKLFSIVEEQPCLIMAVDDFFQLYFLEANDETCHNPSATTHALIRSIEASGGL